MGNKKKNNTEWVGQVDRATKIIQRVTGKSEPEARKIAKQAVVR